MRKLSIFILSTLLSTTVFASSKNCAEAIQEVEVATSVYGQKLATLADGSSMAEAIDKMNKANNAAISICRSSKECAEAIQEVEVATSVYGQKLATLADRFSIAEAIEEMNKANDAAINVCN
jgi:hypothetical protein